jgi:hypothetical protein
MRPLAGHPFDLNPRFAMRMGIERDAWHHHAQEKRDSR